jgi:hypothetical protein
VEEHSRHDTSIESSIFEAATKHQMTRIERHPVQVSVAAFTAADAAVQRCLL